MGKIIGISIGILVSVSILSGLLSNMIDKSNDIIDRDFRSKIGKDVVYKGDTLMVVDYSILNESLTLEDGSVINNNLFESIELK